MAAPSAITPVQKLGLVLSSGDIREQFDNCLKSKAPAFVASLLDLYGGDSYLQRCDPKLVAMEALKAATLDLPINKQLGFAYIVPYKDKPVFTIGYKGYIQLAQRSGLYSVINAAVIPEGLKIDEDWITGEIVVSGEPSGDTPQGYLAHFRLLNGFKKTLYMSKGAIQVHAKKYAKSYSYENSVWRTNFDEMAMKTCLRLLLGKYGPMSTEMQKAFSTPDDEDEEQMFEDEVKEKANQEAIDVEYTVNEEVEEEAPKQKKTAEKPKPEPKPEPAKRRGPSY